MKGILVLLVLLNTKTTEVGSQPYKADSDGNCRNSTTEYLLEGSDLCCKKCLPGQRLIQECSETTDSVCEQCSAGQYMESWNYASNCFSCTKCKTIKGLQEAQRCSSTTRSRCVCRPGMYCVMGYDETYCAACRKYRICKAGYGVSVPGTGNADVRCEQCPAGSFSDTASSTDACQPHTNCRGRAVVREGDATTDTVCEPELFTSSVQPQTSTKERRTETASTTQTTVMSTSSATTGPEALHSTVSVSERLFNSSTKNTPQSDTESDGTLYVAVIASVIGLIFVIAIVLLCLRKRVCKKDAASFHPKVDANGNCENGDGRNQDYLAATKLSSFTAASPEEQCLLQKVEACSDHSHCSNTEALTRHDGCSSQESISPLQSTVALHSPLPALSEPTSLLSNTEPVTPQPSVPQPSSQPTSPQVISPATNPHVNVNITFHIGNGTCGMPSVTPTDLTQVDSKLPFGEEEESFSIPQQEAGKQSLVSVQESESSIVFPSYNHTTLEIS